MLNVNIFSNNLLFVKIIKKNFTIKNVYSDKPVDKNFRIFCNKKSIKYKRILKKKDLKKIIDKSVDLGLIFGFGLIFDKNFIKKFKYGIWNFHTGDLPKFRGRHPLTWAFLNDEKKIAMSVHSINQNIDQGYLIHKYFVQRTYKDDLNTILDKILIKLDKEIIKIKKKIFLKKKKKLSKGNYFPPLFKGIQNIESCNNTSKYAFNAIKAQKIYGGTKIDGKIYKDVFFFNKKNINTIKKFKILIFKDKKKLILLKK